MYKAAKQRWKNISFPNKPNLNIRSSWYIRTFIDCNFKIHNGKYFIVNSINDFKEIYKKHPFTYFKLGQFSYNRHVFMRNRPFKYDIIVNDIRKKKGFDVKFKKKKKSIFSLV